VVASVTGLSGLAAGLAGTLFTLLVGTLVDRFSYFPALSWQQPRPARYRERRRLDPSSAPDMTVYICWKIPVKDIT